MRYAAVAAVAVATALVAARTPRARASIPDPAPPAGSKAYVTNSNDDTVTVVALPGMTPIATLSVGDDPQSPAATPNGDLVFVPNLLGSQFPAEPAKGGPKGMSTVTRPSVSVIDTATDSVIAAIPLTRDGPRNCVVSPDGSTLYVTCSFSDAVSVVDIASLTETAIIGLATSGGDPDGIAITPDGTKLYVCIPGDNAVRTVDTASLSVVGSSLFVGSRPHDVDLTADGTKAFVVGDGDPRVIETATDTVTVSSFADIGTQTCVRIVGNLAHVANSSFFELAVAKRGPKAAPAPFDSSLDLYDLATGTYVDSIRVDTAGVFAVDLLRDGSLAFVTTDGVEGDQALREVYPEGRRDTNRAATVGFLPRGVVVVQPRPVVNSFFLPKKVAYKKNAATPSKSKFSAGGFFDTGSRVVDLTAAATLTVGAVDIPVPSLTAASNGRTFTYQAGGLKFVVVKNPFGSSRAKFRLTNKGDLGPSVPTDGALTLRFKNAAVDGQCEVALEKGGFRIGKKRGSLSKPNLFVVRANGVLGGTEKDAFGIIVGLATNGQTPPAAQEVRVEFGSTLKATIPAGSFTRKGEQDVFKGDVNGVTDVTVDYLRETVTIFGKGATLGAFVEGQNPITIFVGVGADDRGVAVRIARDGKLLKY